MQGVRTLTYLKSFVHAVYNHPKHFQSWFSINKNPCLPFPFNYIYLIHFSTFGINNLLATHSSTLAWKIPWTEGPGRLQSMGTLGVRHDWETSLSLFTFMHWRRKWQPTPVFLPGESQGWGAWWAAVYGVTQSQTRLKQLSSWLFWILWFSMWTSTSI